MKNKYIEVIKDALILLAVSTVFVTVVNALFKTIKREAPRDPLVTAIAQDSAEKIHQALTAKGLETPSAKKDRVNLADARGRTPLMWAAYVDFSQVKLSDEADGKRLVLVNLLAEAGADPNLRDKDGWTPLTWAAWSGLTKVAARLVELGARVNEADRQGQTPLMIAASRGNTAIVEMLLNRGADKAVTAKDGRTAKAYAEEGQRTYPKRTSAYQAAIAVL